MLLCGDLRFMEAPSPKKKKSCPVRTSGENAYSGPTWWIWRQEDPNWMSHRCCGDGFARRGPETKSFRALSALKTQRFVGDAEKIRRRHVAFRSRESLAERRQNGIIRRVRNIFYNNTVSYAIHIIAAAERQMVFYRKRSLRCTRVHANIVRR